MRLPRNGSGDRNCRESWRTSGRRSLEDSKVRNPFPPTATPFPAARMLPLASCAPFLCCPASLAHLLFTACPQPPPPALQTDDASHETQEPESFSAWSDRMAGNMPRSASSSVRQREPADPHGLRAPVTAGGSKRRSSGCSESEPGPRRRNCVRAGPGGRRRLPGTRCQSQPGPGPGQSTPEEQGGAASGASAMCPGPALGEGTQRPWLQPWWPGAPPWRNREL